MTDEETRLDFIEKHAPRALYHYVHAIEKHPYFCDRITYLSETGVDTHLQLSRELLETAKYVGDVDAVSVIQYELYEAVQAYTHGDIAHAVDECYGAIAELLRTIDMLEGRQKLGKPETNS